MKLLFENWREYLKEGVFEANIAFHIGPSKIQGTGIFASEQVPKGTNLGAAHIRRDGEYIFTPFGKYYNHSSDPNCASVLEGSVDENYSRSLVALKDLSPNEEIVVDYTLQPELEQPTEDWS